MRKGHVLGIALAVVIALGMGSRIALAESDNCGRVGTWFGQSDTGFTWMDIDTPGANATVGQIDLDWILIDPTLGGFFPTSARVTAAKGVWEKVNERKYKYTWVAYALTAAGEPVVVARTSGFATMAGCDRVNLTYTLELFGPDQDIWKDSPSFGAFSGTGVEQRMPLIVVQQ